MDLRTPQLIDIAAHDDARGVHQKFFGATPENIVVPEYSIAEVFMTTNNKNTVRGFHFQVPGQPKLVQVVSGAVKGNILCCNPNDPAFGKAITFFLQENSRKKLYVPGDWALGYRSLEDNTRVLYLAGADFVASGDVAIDPFDPALVLDWSSPTDGELEFTKEAAILSDRDKNLPPFADFANKIKKDGVKND